MYFHPFLPFTGVFNRRKVDLIGENDKIAETEFDLNYSKMRYLLGMAKLQKLIS